MGKPAILSGPVPVLHIGRNDNDIAGMKLLRFFTVSLIPATSTGDEKDLPSAGAVVDMPVIAASGFKGYVGNRAAFLSKRL